MKKTLLFAAIAATLVMFTACESDDNLGLQTTEHIVFNASLPTIGSGTTPASHIKTTIINTDANDTENRGKVSWEQSDQITITDGTNTAIYGVDTNNGSSATFKYVSGDQLATSGVTYQATYGAAPVTAQTYSAEVTELPMTATSNTKSLKFSVTCGLLKLHLTKAGESVKSIAVSDGTTTYTLTCETAQSIDGGKDFFIALPAGTYTTFTITNSQDEYCSISNATGVTIEANTIQPLDFASKLIFPEYVDLGLSVKWATCNIGASSPEGYGDYYTWGETETKSNYSWSTYFDTTDGGSTFTKYNHNGGKTTLELSDDVAHVKWGGSWRMPTEAEQDELINNCTWTWTTQNGTNGYSVTGPNGHSIFLPAAGYHSGTSLSNAGSCGYYWSSSLKSDESYQAYCLSFSSGVVKWYYSRCGGRTVRAVYAVHVTDITLNKTELELFVDDTETLTATIAPADATNQNVTWTSSNTAVATVSSTGVVTAVAAGTTTITATTVDGDKTATCEVTVLPLPEAVDLGLSVKWATFNIGANAPEDYGDYYAWGETETKSTYDWSNYFDTTDGGNTFTKYNNNGGKTTLELSDDVAHVKWGGSWRMPTLAEQQELINNCIWTWTTQNGKNGYKFTGYNGNSIFLPTAGFRHDTNLSYAGSSGYYWSSSLYSSYSDDAYGLHFLSSLMQWGHYRRYYGQGVRPVCP